MDNPLDPYDSSMAVLESGLIDKAGISKVSVAGHPEGSPDITDEAIKEALAWKNSFAERTGAELDIVTQFAFEAEPLIAWDRRINAEGNKLPIRIGLPGLASIKTLLGFSKAAGVGNSIRFLMKRSADVSKLMIVNAPDKQVIDLALCCRRREPRYQRGPYVRHWWFEAHLGLVLCAARRPVRCHQ